MWIVLLTSQVKKTTDKLPKNIKDSFLVLLLELERLGFQRNNWPHFGKLIGKNNSYHCHLKGNKRPTFVACWYVVNKEKKIIEVYYVGSHENSPY
jgi:mRNA-degrading endonuclease RelE of RelBE toxin-antitoxin system